MSQEKPDWEQITEDGQFPEDKEVEETNEPELSEVEVKAMEKGWVPEDQWEGNPDDWRSAKEFMDRSSFFEKISNQNREIYQLKEDIRAAREHLQKLHKAQGSTTVTKLEQQKVEALEQGNYDDVVKIEKEIREAEKVSEEPEVPDAVREGANDPLFTEWLNDNPWYNDDQERRIFADSFGISFRQNNPNATPEEVYEHVTKAVKRTFPDKFNSPRTEAQTTQTNNQTRPTSTKKTSSGFTPNDLSEDQTRVGRRFVKLGLYDNLQAYVDDLAQAGDI